MAEAEPSPAAASPTPPAPAPPVRPRVKAAPWLRSAVSRHGLDRCLLWVALALLVSAAVFFGWRGLSQVGATACAAAATFLLVTAVIKFIRPTASVESPGYVLAMCILLGCVMPLTTNLGVKALAGMMLGLVMHVVGRTAALRIHPVALAIVLTWGLTLGMARVDPSARGLVDQRLPSAVLRPNRLLVGDVFDVGAWAPYQPWWEAGDTRSDAIIRPTPQDALLADQARILVDPAHFAEMLRDGRLPRIEELILGCVPGPVGASSLGLVLLLGLLLMPLHLARPKVVIAGFVAALLTLLVMPVSLPSRDIIALELLGTLPLDVALTCVGYILLCGPLPIIILLLAPVGMPMCLLGRLVYAVLLGGGAVAGQWFFQTHEGAYLGLILAGALSRPLDSLKRTGLA